jgi:hypothetical protein
LIGVSTSHDLDLYSGQSVDQVVGIPQTQGRPPVADVGQQNRRVLGVIDVEEFLLANATPTLDSHRERRQSTHLLNYIENRGQLGQLLSDDPTAFERRIIE